MKRQKVFVIITSLLLQVGAKFLLGAIYPDNKYLNSDIRLNGACGVVMLMLVADSKIFQTVYWRIFLVLFAVSIIGSLFRLQHWPGGKEILATVYFIALLTYAVRFTHKIDKKPIDVIKIAAFSLYCLNNILHTYRIDNPIIVISYVVAILSAYFYICYNLLIKRFFKFSKPRL